MISSPYQLVAVAADILNVPYSMDRCALPRGVGKGGHAPSEIATLNFFCLNSMEFVAFNQIFSIFFVFWGFTADTTGGSMPVWTVSEPTLLSPSETNSWLCPWLSSVFASPDVCLPRHIPILEAVQ